MKRIILIVLIVLGMVSCKKEVEVEMFIKQFDHKEMFVGKTTGLKAIKGSKSIWNLENENNSTHYTFDTNTGYIHVSIKYDHLMQPSVGVTQRTNEVFTFYLPESSIIETDSNIDGIRQFRVLFSSISGTEYITFIINEPTV